MRVFVEFVTFFSIGFLCAEAIEDRMLAFMAAVALAIAVAYISVPRGEK